MLQKKYIGVVMLLFVTGVAAAQKVERDLIRKGNRLYKDSVYVDAEVNYRKALEVNPQSTISMFNLGNALLRQNKLQEAMEQFASAAKIEKDKEKLAQIFHNIGVIFQSQKDYVKAIEVYKESLRNNPKDDETRYNLALAQKMLKDQQQNEQNMSKENAEQLLNSVMQDEKDVQDKVKKQQVIQGSRLEKDW